MNMKAKRRNRENEILSSEYYNGRHYMCLGSEYARDFNITMVKRSVPTLWVHSVTAYGL